MEWLKLKNSDNTKCWQECRESKLLNTLLVEMNGTATLKTSLAVSLKTKHATTIQPSICVSEQLSQRTGLHMKTCTWIFIAALFILSETGNNQMLKMSFSMWSCQDFSDSSVGKESACNAGDPGLIPGSGKSPGEEIGYPLQYSWTSLVAQLVKNPSATWETCVRSLAWEDPLEKGKAIHSRRIPEYWVT